MTKQHADDGSLTIAAVVAIIEQCRDSSEQRWEAAIDTDDSERNFGADADECLSAYDDAIESLNDAYEGYIDAARTALEMAESAERAAGDPQDAQRAIAALDRLDPAADR